jgi:hypothetical protein
MVLQAAAEDFKHGAAQFWAEIHVAEPAQLNQDSRLKSLVYGYLDRSKKSKGGSFTTEANTLMLAAYKKVQVRGSGKGETVQMLLNRMQELMNADYQEEAQQGEEARTRASAGASLFQWHTIQVRAKIAPLLHTFASCGATEVQGMAQKTVMGATRLIKTLLVRLALCCCIQISALL